VVSTIWPTYANPEAIIIPWLNTHESEALEERADPERVEEAQIPEWPGLNKGE